MFSEMEKTNEYLCPLACPPGFVIWFGLSEMGFLKRSGALLQAERTEQYLQICS